MVEGRSSGTAPVDDSLGRGQFDRDDSDRNDRLGVDDLTGIALADGV